MLAKGKLQPQALEMEAAIISAIMIQSSAFVEVSGKLRADMFYSKKYAAIYTACKSLFDANQPIDLLTISEKLKSQGKLEFVGGDFELINLSQKVASTAHLEHHVLVVVEKFLKRQVISLSNEALQKAFSNDVDVFDLLDFVGAGIDGVNDVIASDYSSLSWHDAMMEMPKRVEFLTNNQGKITGLPTGLIALDKHFSGWQPTDFIVIGADSGMGKTAFVMTSMLASAKSGSAVGMFSMEMSVQQLAIRATAVESQFHMNQLARNGFEKNEYFLKLTNVVNDLKDLPIYIDDKPALTVPEMKRKARALKRKNDIKILVIDFLQMFSGDKEVRLNVGEAARECKNLAKELKIPVIALSQLSREVKKQKYMIPQKYHLKEASTIEEAADVIGLLYRPGYYGYTPESNPDLYNDLGLEGEDNAVLMVAKNRNGALGNVSLKYLENKTKYVNSGAAAALEYESIKDVPF